MKKSTLLAAVALMALASATAGAARLSDEPGYVDLEWIPIPGHAEEVQDIDLSEVLLAVAADAEETGDPDLAKALSMVRSIRVKAYSLTPADLRQAEESVGRINEDLERSDWTRLVYVKEKTETISVSTKRHNDRLVGLTVVFMDPEEEVAFVNVVGELDLATLFKVAQKFDTDELEDLFEEIEDDYGHKDRGHDRD